MARRLAIIICLLALAAPSLAQDAGVPMLLALVEKEAALAVQAGILDALQAHEFISAEERDLLLEAQELAGERIHVVMRKIGPDLADISLQIETALDQGADAIIAHTSAAAQAAVNITMDLDYPPAVIFAGVVNPYDSGIAQSRCVKPDHVTGMITEVPYADILALLLLQDPDMQTFGTIHSSNDMDGVYGAEVIAGIARDMGLAVESVAIAGQLADLPMATAGLISRGVEAIVLPLDLTMGAGIPIVAEAAVEHGLPLFYATPGSVLVGATVGGGAMLYYDEGLHAGYLAAAQMLGEIDIARTGLHSAGNMFVGVNLDVARLQGIEIAEALLSQATLLVDGGELEATGAAQLELARAYGLMPLEDRREEQAMLMMQMQCSDEEIAEQQAELDAVDG